MQLSKRVDFSCTVLKSHKSPQKISEGSISTHPEDWRYVTKSCAGEFKEDAQVTKNSCNDQTVLKHRFYSMQGLLERIVMNPVGCTMSPVKSLIQGKSRDLSRMGKKPDHQSKLCL